MKSIVKALESIGQKSSIKQFSSSEEMHNHVAIGDDILSMIENQQMDYICHQQTPDEDED